MKPLRIVAPAKTNFILRIIRKRPDGFHDLVTLFHRISLCDEIFISTKLSSGLDLKVSSKKYLPKGKQNIIHKAYDFLSQKLGSRPGLRVRLKKQIPIGAGLGGGSSDAASFLIGANQLLDLRLPYSEMCDLGVQIGSDVPFFLKDVPLALGEGQGERIKPMAFNSVYFFVIVGFRNQFSTKEMYKIYDTKCQQPLSLTKVRANVKICASFLKKGHLHRAQRLFINDFTLVAEKKLKVLAKVLHQWKVSKVPAFLSGSGSSVIAVYADQKLASRDVKRLKKQKNLNVYLAQSFHENINAKIKEELNREDNRSSYFQKR